MSAPDQPRGGRFRDRREAGRQLAALLDGLDLHEPVVLALPRGGVPVAYEVAGALDAPLDVLLTRKVGAPGHVELGIGAVAEGGVTVADDTSLRILGVSRERFATLASLEERELKRRQHRYRGNRDLPPLTDRDVLIVDDGLATGVTAQAAIVAARQHQPRRVILAVPTCAPDTARRLRALADAVICVVQPEDFVAVGQWYDKFGQTTDAEVVELLEQARTAAGERT